MANQEHLEVLKQGVNAWNQWRKQHPHIEPDLFGVNLKRYSLNGIDLTKTDLREANLYGADLKKANFVRAYLIDADLLGANLSKADLRDANLFHADLAGANLFGATLHGATLCGANLMGANLQEANLSDADLSGANLSDANLIKANLTGSRIYAISAWNVKLEESILSGLIITREDEPTITVEDLETAQFIYLLLNNARLRHVIDTITSKVVLILGRFTPERKTILDALRKELRQHNYTPVLFDFEKPASRDLTETVSTLAHLARFIIVDLTDPSSVPHEVATVIPHTVVPVQPLLWQEPLLVDGKVVERREYAMFEDLRRRYHWVLPTVRYQDTAKLLDELPVQIIAPAEQKARELMQPK